MKNLFIVVCLLLLGLSASSQQVAKSLTSSGGVFIGFLQYTPVNYKVDTTKKYPLIIFLHGIGERGDGSTQLMNITANGIPKYINAGNTMTFTSLSGVTETFLVLSPQLSTAYGYWPMFYVDEMLNYARQNLRIDTNRIFLTGLSLGGGGTWSYITNSVANAKTFAASAVVCGTCAWSNMCNLATANLPVWAFHAVDDGTVPVACTNNAISNFMACNPVIPPIKTIYPSGNHWIWDKAYDTVYNFQNPNVFEWFLGQSRALPINQLPIANAGPDRILALPLNDIALNSTGSMDKDGRIARYVWRMIQSPGGGYLASTNTASTHVYYMSQGVYKFELTVVDDRAGWAVDTVQVTVNPTSANIPPVAKAGKDSITKSLTINLDATASYDPDGFVAAYKWTEISGPSTVIVSCNTCATTPITNLANGTYTMQVAVTDNIGAVTLDTVHIIETGSLLPAGIVYFNGKNMDRSNVLQWTTASEFNSDHFVIERSNDGKSFTAIGSVAGAGTSTTAKEYNFTDANAPENLSFYRLRQVDKDGSFKFSDVVRINNSLGRWKVETYPNPVIDELLIQLESKEKGSVTVRLLNQQGQMIREQLHQKIGEQVNIRMITKSLSPGIYFVELRIGDAVKEIRKIIKG